MFACEIDPGRELTPDERQLVERADELHGLIGRAQRELLSLIAEIDRCESWDEDGAQSAAHWVSMRYGISYWKAERWVSAAHALESLPLVAAALASGELGIDKVVELTRFATPETESELVSWARTVASGGIRRRAERERKRERRETVDADRDRTLRTWYEDDGKRFGMLAELPADQGAIVEKAIERLAESVPMMPDEGEPQLVDARRADALVALCSSRLADDADADRATVVVHVSAQTLSGANDCNAEVDNGPAVAADTARRLACNGRLQVLVEDGHGQALRLGRLSRDPSPAMLRQLRYRDRECRFDGCGARRFTDAHHVQWWSRGGRTDLDNLVLLCSFHHRLVHEHGWRLSRHPDNSVTWFRPTGVRYRAGPAPPRLATPA